METALLLLLMCTPSVDCPILQQLLKMVNIHAFCYRLHCHSPMFTYLQVVNEMGGAATAELLYTNPSLRCLLIEQFLPAMEQTAVMMTARLPLMK